MKGALGHTCAGVGWSTKLQAVLDELDFVNREHPGDKVVIFSQFTSFLDIVQAALRVRRGAHDGDAGVEGGWGGVSCGGGKVARLDGSMSRAKRSLAIAAFTNDADTDVLLVSIKAGGTGLNLVSANHVFITDLWWNSAVEAQVSVYGMQMVACHGDNRVHFARARLLTLLACLLARVLSRCGTCPLSFSKLWGH